MKYIYTYIYNLATSLIYVVFFINVVKLRKPLSKLDHPTPRMGSRKERTHGINH